LAFEMSTDTQLRLAFSVFLFSFLGLGLETAFTAALDYPKRRDNHLMGYSSLWYVPLYALAPIVFYFWGRTLFAYPWYVRGLIYTALIYAIEYAGMWALRRLLGSSPSEAGYYESRWHVHGLIRLDFAPFWFAAGLLFEWAYRVIHRV